MKYPDFVIIGLTKLLKEIPVEDNSDDWRIIQTAISLLNFPDSFKKKVHVFLTSLCNVREEGCYDIQEMTIKIYTHKIIVKRRHDEYNSLCDIDRKQIYRYIYPNEKYCASDFNRVMEDTDDLFCENDTEYHSDPSGFMLNSSNFKIESNILFSNRI